MPIYEYQCIKCGKTLEALQKFSDAPLTTCESCKGELKKLISHSAFHLKGSGWYVTDYANKKPGVAPPAKENDTGKTETKAKPEKAKAKKADTD